MKRPQAIAPEQSGLALAEEAMLLLRNAPIATLLCHFAGTLPFVLGVLYFIADMSLDAYAPESIVGSSLWVALLFVWMKCWHAVFLLRLVETLGGEPVGKWTPRRIARLAFTQAAFQPWSLLIRPAALVITLPYVWVKSYYENLLMAGDGRPRQLRQTSAEAQRQALLWTRQNWESISVHVLFVFFVWANLFAALAAIPFMLKTFLGLESDITRSVDTLFNTTTFSATFGATYLCTNPVWKAACAIRWFRGKSIQSGADLRAALHRLRNRAAAAAVAIILAFGFAVCPVASAAFSSASPAPASAPAPPAAAAGEINAAVEKTLERREFAWRLPRQETGEKKGWLASFFEGISRQVSKWVKAVSKWIGQFLERWFKSQLRDPLNSQDKPPRDFSTLVRVVIALTTLIVGTLCYFVWRQLKLRPIALQAVADATSAVPDLTSEAVTADQLPEDGWLKLAREMQARGELRLALRALYLAALAHLGARKLIMIARHKSNRDYERELGRRARQQPELAETFRSSRAVFEASWYGSREVTGDLLGAFEHAVERMRAC